MVAINTLVNLVLVFDIHVGYVFVHTDMFVHVLSCMTQPYYVLEENLAAIVEASTRQTSACFEEFKSERCRISSKEVGKLMKTGFKLLKVKPWRC